MQIGEVAERTSLTVDAIRFYERRKLLPQPGRSTGGFRRYSETTISRLRFIRQMQGLGFRLSEIGELIELREHKVQACEAVRELLQAKLAGVRLKLRELHQLEAQLERDLRKCKHELRHRRKHAASPCPVLQTAEDGNEN
jgi:MerR family mercuric resistance operon transcriptional regulator